MTISELIAKYFSLKIKKEENGCWLWQANKNQKGYGLIKFPWRGKWITRGAHRALYELLIGKVPAGKELDHKCRVRHCVNPAHMEPVTHLENIQRGQSGKHLLRRTHCVNNHPLNQDNVRYVIKDGKVKKRACRVCNKLAMRKFRAAA